MFDWFLSNLSFVFINFSRSPTVQIIITSIFSVCKDVKDCILLAADSVGLQNIPSFEVEMHDHTDWIKATQVNILSLAIDY